jgi:hypothetical protein
MSKKAGMVAIAVGAVAMCGITTVSAAAALIWDSRVHPSGKEGAAKAVATDGARVYEAGWVDETGVGTNWMVRAQDAFFASQRWLDVADPAGRDDAALAIAASGGKVFAVGAVTTADSTDWMVRAYQGESGTILWQDQMDADGGEDVAQAVAVGGGSVFVAGTSSSIDGDPSDVSLVVRAYKAGTGKLLWEQAIEPPAGFLEATVAFESPIAVDGGKVFVAGRVTRASSESDFAVWAFDASSGSVLWQDQVVDPGMADGAAGMAVTAGRVFVSGTVGTASTVRAYDEATGSVAWDAPVEEGGSTPRVAAGDGRVVVASASCVSECDLAMRAYDAASGAALWSDVLGRRGSQTAEAVILQGGDAIVSASDSRGSGVASMKTIIRAYKASNGHRHWEESADGGSYGMTALTTRLFVGGWAAHTDAHHIDFAVRSFEMAAD